MSFRSELKWTDAVIAELKHAWEKTTESASSIGRRFGTSKGAIIGKARRMGLQKFFRHKPGPVAKEKPKPGPVAKEKPKPKPPRKPKYGPVDFLNLHSESCRWPLDDGMYCGQKKVRGSYCADHAARAHHQTRRQTESLPKRAAGA